MIIDDILVAFFSALMSVFELLFHIIAAIILFFGGNIRSKRSQLILIAVLILLIGYIALAFY